MTDEAARDFAAEFYGQFVAGLPLGEAMAAARRSAASQPGDPTWLAYTVYGHPRARLSPPADQDHLEEDAVQVIEDGVPVDALIQVIKNSVRQAGVSRVSDPRDLTVASVQLTLRVMASSTVGGGLKLRVPVIGAEIRVGARVTRQDTHTIDIILVPPDEALREVRGGDVENALVQAIATIRETMASAANGDEPWVLSTSTVEISFVITKSGTISLGAEGELTNEVTHSLHLGLTPVDA